MKILQLRFKNLNSLYGEWCLDFSSPEYLASGIFAITGPTGAGKSTILDALCLALYGQTPRLKKINQSENEIMSRRTGECFAEVTFEALRGRFRCHWSQHRAYKKADGKLADSKHEIADASSGQLLETQKRRVEKAVEEKTGMNFDRFTRSILLAQGEFSKFLHAGSDKRAPILEQITGTEIYSDISKKVHERQRDEQEKLNLLQAETAGVALLSEEQEAELVAKLEQLENSKQTLFEQQQETIGVINWLNAIEQLRLELVESDRQIAKVTAKSEDFSGERKRLERGQKAAELSGDFATLCSLRSEQKAERRSLEKNEKQLPSKSSFLSQKEELLKKAAQSFSSAKEARAVEAPLIVKVRTLDLQLLEKKKLAQEGVSEFEKIALQMTTIKADRAGHLQKKQELQQQLKNLVDYQDHHRGDELLVEQLAGIEEQLSGLQLLGAERKAKREAVGGYNQQLEKGLKFHKTQEKIFTEKKRLHQTSQQAVIAQKEKLANLLGRRLLREYRAEYEALMREMAFLRRISDLEAERKRLEDDKACPLCGATEHPWALGNVPEIDQVEKKVAHLSVFIKKAEDVENSIKELEQKEKDALLQMDGAEKKLTQGSYKNDEISRNLQRATGELTEASSRFEKLQRQVLERVQPFFSSSQVKLSSEKEVRQVLAFLTGRQKKWQECQDKKAEFEKRLSSLDGEIKEQDGILGVINESQKKRQKNLAELQEEVERLQLDRRQLYQAKNPDEEEARLERMVVLAEKAENRAREGRDLARQQLDETKTQIRSLKDQLRKRKIVLEEGEKNFLDHCKKVGFEDEAAFTSCRLSAEQIQHIAAKAQELDSRLAELNSGKKDRKSRLAEELKKALSEATLKELGKAATKLEGLLKEKTEEIGACKQRLKDDKAAREGLQKRLDMLESQKAELRRWQNLHFLIGSADGKKYRNFAQGITFELMVSHANRQLTKLTDRYLLLRDEEQPLELNVIDNYQAGEVRSTKNLSGGESFMVSLSLALGLSKMASRKVRVDSLFLDEGFGTLDEESLDMALDTLAGLQQDGKLIGVISHVGGLKERIATQIEVSPLSGGKSSINGPGCSKVKG